eukprot:Gregarina_sp_Poly_1__8721@NODE_520_length_7746_cov_143_641620_g413_i0_p8_GENE_NODE_520_length_7746_cov_143_641620_g413_i0NODE_520_length_7746_cov_143_641620_g413_i0_p8_ORF_typecomplete_len106_score3_98APOBEC1/PF18769_1/0_064_NODE_520_length_7746_cov_143_641620_g413_i064166733
METPGCNCPPCWWKARVAAELFPHFLPWTKVWRCCIAKRNWGNQEDKKLGNLLPKKFRWDGLQINQGLRDWYSIGNRINVIVPHETVAGRQMVWQMYHYAWREKT